MNDSLIADDFDGSGLEQSSASAPRPKRKHQPGLSRSRIACQRCRRKKYKCDAKSPACSQCEKAQEPCIKVDHHVKPEDLYPLEKCIQQLNQQVHTLRRELATEKQRNLLFVSEAGRTLCLDGGEPGISNDPSVARSQDVASLTASKILGPTFNTANSIDEDDAGFASAIWRLGLDDGLASGHASPASADAPLPTAPQAPSPADGEKLINIYFQYRWPGLPCLHKPTFMEKCYLPVMRGDDHDHASAAMAYLVFAIAAADLHRLEPDTPYLSSHYFQIAAHNYTDGIFAADDIKCIQGLLLLSAYGKIEPLAVNVWHTAGLALRVAVDLGMNRESSNFTDLLASEMRKRVFWCSYVMERDVCFALGRPLSLRNSDIDVGLPLPLTDDELVQGTSCLGYPNRVPGPWDTSTFVHIVKLRRLNVAVIETFYPVVSPGLPLTYYEGVREQLRQQLDEWMAAAPRYRLTVSTFQSTEWLQTAYHYALLSVHRPSPGCAQTTPEGLEICADSGISIVSLMGSLLSKNKMTYAFVSLYMSFMASVTMLYAIQASPSIRQQMTKPVVQANIKSCITLFKTLSQGRTSGDKCAIVVERLGAATLAMFDNEKSAEPGMSQTFQTTNPEFWTWFGMKPPAISSLAVESEFMQMSDMSDFLARDTINPTNFDNPWNMTLDLNLGISSNSFLASSGALTPE